MTEWRAVRRLPGYEVSSEGEIRRVRIGLNGHQPGPLKPHVGSAGYPVVKVAEDGREHNVTVHSLVCEAFHGPKPSPRHQVAHRDGTRTNNREENLRWDTPKGNAADRRCHGSDTIGSAHGCAKLSEEDIAPIIALSNQGVRQRDIAARYGVSQRTIWRIVNRVGWKHVEPTWSPNSTPLFGRAS